MVNHSSRQMKAFSAKGRRSGSVHPPVMADASFSPRKAGIAPANRRKVFRNGAQ
jgi:hypothetical protein